MKAKRTKSIFCTFLLPALFLCACTAGEETELPEGKYPMTLSASVDRLTATRTTAATGKDAWTVDDQITVSVDGGTTSKLYKITDASTGAMTPQTENAPCYWQQSTNQSILAWYPAVGVSNQDIGNQSSGYTGFDYLTSDGTYNYSNGGAATLPFKHQMAKVKFTLQAGEGIADVSSATVGIYGYTKATLASGSLTGKTEDWITPYSSTEQEALVIPQQMQGRPFIKVTLGDAHYFYTPANSSDANLEAGKVYSYTITVKRTELEVTTSTPVSWGNGSSVNSETPSEVSNHVITLPATDTGSPLSSITVTKADGTTIDAETDGAYLLPVSETSFKVSYSTTNCMKSLVIASGLCRMSRNYDSNNASNYTCTYSNVVSDITLAVDDYAEPGDYYYSDGTWSPATPTNTTTAGTSSSVAIGVVFHSGVGKGDDISYYSSSRLNNKIRGYVVAAKDLVGAGTSGKTSYGGKLPKDTYDRLQNFDVPEIANGNNYSYNGFTVMKIIRTYMAQTEEYEFPAFALCDTYGTSTQAAPANSSGWYLPSAAMLGAIYGIREKLTDCPGGSKPNSDYMSCTETGAGGVQGYAFHRGFHAGRSKNDNNTFARAVLTF